MNDLVIIQIPKLLIRIDDFNESNNFESFKKEIHKLKSSITIFGVNRAKELIYEMEMSISETKYLLGTSLKLNELKETYAALLVELRAF